MDKRVVNCRYRYIMRAKIGSTQKNCSEIALYTGELKEAPGPDGNQTWLNGIKREIMMCGMGRHCSIKAAHSDEPEEAPDSVRILTLR